MTSGNVVDTSVQIKATPDKIFEFLTTPGKVQLVLPGLVETQNTPDGRLSEGDSFHYTYQMYGMMLEGTWEVIAMDEPRKYVGKTSGAASSTWSYSLEAQGELTSLNLHIAYDMPESVLEKAVVSVVAAINEKEIKTYLENLKAVFELQ